jgi:hypothetical protein
MKGRYFIKAGIFDIETGKCIFSITDKSQSIDYVIYLFKKFGWELKENDIIKLKNAINGGE